MYVLQRCDNNVELWYEENGDEEGGIINKLTTN